MRNNLIESIENGIFSHMKNLKLFDLSSNRLVIRAFDGYYLAGNVRVCKENNQK